MRIGSVELTGRLILAPMAGVTDRAFRQICREHGAALTVTEMVSSKGLHYKDKKTPALLLLREDDHPTAAQIFGSDPETMAEAAQLALEICGAEIMDINMGCPAPKIAGNGDGSALMRDPVKAGKIIEAVKKAVDVPVTVKFRKGWDASSVNCVEFARMAQESGADFIAVHGRTRAQQYEGKADWDAIAAVKQAVSIPMAANGDVFTAQDAVDIVAHTQADFVMIGRGSLGDPWLFAQANAALAGQPLPEPPSFSQRMAVAARQMELSAVDKNEYVAMLEARRHLNWYLKGISGVKHFKARISQLESLAQMYALIEEMQQCIEE